MAVVINEFEVVSEPPPAKADTGTAGEAQAPAVSQVQKASDTARRLTHHRERLERVRAH